MSYFHWFTLSLLLLLGCDDVVAQVGQRCLTTADCVMDSLCYEQSAGEPVCMRVCMDDERLCDGGEVCVASPSAPELRVCFLGGDIEAGGACTHGGQCRLGTVCVDEGMGGVCRRACDTRQTRCQEREECAPLTEPEGFCRIPEQ